MIGRALLQHASQSYIILYDLRTKVQGIIIHVLRDKSDDGTAPASR